MHLAEKDPDMETIIGSKNVIFPFTTLCSIQQAVIIWQPFLQ